MPARSWRPGTSMRHHTALTRTTPLKRTATRRFIRYDALDALFGRYIRLRDRVCQYCGRSDRRLEAAHIFGRGKHSTRYDPENCYAFCGGPNGTVCHRWLDTHTTEKEAWLERRIGTERFHALRLKSNLPAKVDRVLVRLAILERIKQLEAP